jgi:hypothetical protein
MPLSSDDVVRAIAAAAYRNEDVVVVGGREGYDRPYRIGIAGLPYRYADAVKPDLAVAQLFDDLLGDGFIRAEDFQPQVDRLPLYRLGAHSTPQTLPWLSLFLSTKYLRIKYPDDSTPFPKSGEVSWEFAISAHGGPDSAASVVESVAANLHL